MRLLRTLVAWPHGQPQKEWRIKSSDAPLMHLFLMSSLKDRLTHHLFPFGL